MISFEDGILTLIDRKDTLLRIDFKERGFCWRNLKEIGMYRDERFGYQNGHHITFKIGIATILLD